MFKLFNQDGVKETGVSLAFTVRALDAGPIIACQRMGIDDQIKVGYAYLKYEITNFKVMEFVSQSFDRLTGYVI